MRYMGLRRGKETRSLTRRGVDMWVAEALSIALVVLASPSETRMMLVQIQPCSAGVASGQAHALQGREGGRRWM
jgi:hypothetical protein